VQAHPHSTFWQSLRRGSWLIFPGDIRRERTAWRIGDHVWRLGLPNVLCRSGDASIIAVDMDHPLLHFLLNLLNFFEKPVTDNKL
jgi:hypothetical protein